MAKKPMASGASTKSNGAHSTCGKAACNVSGKSGLTNSKKTK